MTPTHFTTYKTYNLTISEASEFDHIYELESNVSPLHIISDTKPENLSEIMVKLSSNQFFYRKYEGKCYLIFPKIIMSQSTQQFIRQQYFGQSVDNSYVNLYWIAPKIRDTWKVVSLIDTMHEDDIYIENHNLQQVSLLRPCMMSNIKRSFYTKGMVSTHQFIKEIRKQFTESHPKVTELLDMISATRNVKSVGRCLFSIDPTMVSLWESWCYENISEYVLGTVKLWSKRFKPSHQSIRTLKCWARMDSPTQFNKYIQEEAFCYLNNVENELASYDIAKVMFIMYGDQYTCSSFVGRDWYRFKNHRWCEDAKGVSLSKRITNEVLNMFLRMSKTLHESALTELDLEKKTKIVKKSQMISSIIIKMKSTSFKRDIMKEACEIMYCEDFENRLDTNLHLIGFNNGVYCLDNLYFRSGSPEDMISFTTGLDYALLSECKDDYNKSLGTFLDQILPKKQIQDYVMTFLASTLEGGNKTETFNIWLGSGGNGKSKLVELFEDVFGDYTCKIPISLLTQRRNKSNAASPEVARTKGKRFSVLQEPDENVTLNIGLMKELSGGDVITARKLRKDPIEFKPQFKLLLLCNQLPSIPANDGGTWRRLRVVRFESEFVNKVKKPNQFLKDANLTKKFNNWKLPFFHRLLCYYKQYKQNGITEPDEVIANTKEYQYKCDSFLQFVDESLDINKENNDLSINLTTAYNTFKLWYQDNIHEKPPPRSEFKELMIRQFGAQYSRRWRGYPLNPMNNVFNFIKYISSGSYGIVIAVENILDGKKYALKMIPILEDSEFIVDKLGMEVNSKNITFNKDNNLIVNFLPEASPLDTILTEIKILANMDHPNINKYHNSYITKIESTTTNQMLCVIQMEYYDTTLDDYINHYIVSSGDRLKIIQQLICGTKYLHDHNIIHNDLSPKNILVKIDKISNNIAVAITDFGSSIHMFNDFNISKLKNGGTYPWLAPELTEMIGSSEESEISIYSEDNIQYLSKSIDIYALGIIIYQISYKIKTVSELICSLKTNNLFDGVLSDCMNIKPRRRPNIQQLQEWLPKNMS